MSHFTVLVIGENPEEQLAPFQENNMGTCPKEYLKYRYDEQFYESEAAAKEAVGDAFDHEDGYWENPNSKWDWYVLGGRWTGFVKLKEMVEAVTGSPGIFTAPAKEGYGDQCFKHEIDFDHMRNEAGKKAEEDYDFAMSIIGDLPVNRKWSEIGAELNYSQEARNTYWSQPRCEAWKNKENEMGYKDFPFSFRSSPDDFLMSKSDYVENARNSAVTTHAVIKDGKWYEAGRMGWWAIVLDEKDSSVWNAEFSKLIDELSEDTLLSVYDCHI